MKKFLVSFILGFGFLSVVYSTGLVPKAWADLTSLPLQTVMSSNWTMQVMLCNQGQASTVNWPNPYCNNLGTVNWTSIANEMLNTVNWNSINTSTGAVNWNLRTPNIINLTNP